VTLTVLAILLLTIVGLPLALFVLHTIFLCIVSLTPFTRRAPPLAAAPSRRFVVIVPAHNEELLIANTVRSIMQSNYPAGQMELVVIADNCSDKTAAIARENGATCLERNDLEKRGKPWALNWVLQQIDLAKFDALVIIDADTGIHADFLRHMDAHLGAGNLALQGYFGVMNPDQTWLTRLSLLPGTLKFRLHFPGKEVLGLSCILAGNGMCFDMSLIRRFGWNAFSLTENWEYWVQLTLSGIRVGSAPDAHIYSQVARSLDSGRSQRQRWMKGRIQTLLSYGKELALRGLREPSAAKLDALIEVARPSHAMLFLWSLLFAGLAAALSAWIPALLPSVWIAASLVGLQIAYFLLGFVIEKPPLRTWLALLMIPWYLMWKLVVSIQGVRTLGNRAWVRTNRHSP